MKMAFGDQLPAPIQMLWNSLANLLRFYSLSHSEEHVFRSARNWSIRSLCISMWSKITLVVLFISSTFKVAKFICFLLFSQFAVVRLCDSASDNTIRASYYTYYKLSWSELNEVKPHRARQSRQTTKLLSKELRSTFLSLARAIVVKKLPKNSK